jgi:xanthine dehydrogenase small subunit
MREHVLLYLNGRPVEVRGDDVFLTLSDFLRRRRGLTGTKVVCAEGDCGSCAVLIGRVEGDRLRYAAVTSCIQFVVQLDGAHVVTIEGLRDGGTLNPVQQAMVQCQGTQCGFCTPGFVVALYDLMQGGKKLDVEHARRGLVGNLCRCTGYDSILQAATTVDPMSLKALDELYPPGPIVEALSRAAHEEVRIWMEDKRYLCKPTDLGAALGFRSELPDCVVIAGATDMGVVYNKRMRDIDVVLSLSAIPELREVSCDGNVLSVGACATLTALEHAALMHLPELGRFLAFFGSPLIKNAGTLGGNIVTGSPIGDTIPALVALEAEVDIAALGAQRRVPMSAFYTGYRETVLAPEELVTRVRIPLPKFGETFKLYKVSRRKDLDISGFGAAIWMRQTNGMVEDLRIVYGGVGPMVMRMTNAEDAIRGHPPTLERFERAAGLARDQVTPITDVRGSEQYRRTLAHNILLKFWHETFAGADGAGRNGDGVGNGSPLAPADGPRSASFVHSGGGGGG